MMISVHDFFNVQGQVKYPSAKGTSSKGQQNGAQGLAHGENKSGGFQQMVEDVAGKAEQASCSHEGTSCQGEQQADTGHSAEERIVFRLREMGIVDEDIPQILEQLTEPSLGSLLVAARIRQGQSLEIPVSERNFSENDDLSRSIQELLSSLRADRGEPAQIFSKLTVDQQQGLQELLSRVRAEHRPFLRDILDLKVDSKGAVTTTGFEKLQGTAGPNDQSSLEVGRINGKEGLQQIVSRLNGFNSNQMAENRNDSALRFDMTHARNDSSAGRRDFSELPPIHPDRGPHSAGVVKDSERIRFAQHSGNQVQILQEGSQENGRGLFSQNEPSLGKDSPGWEVLRFVSEGKGKGAGSLFENTIPPSQGQTLHGVQQMNPSHPQAKQTAMPFSQQQPMESNVVNQVFVRLVSGIQQGSRSMVINMHPPELGRVKVSLVSDNGRLSAVLHTENQQVQGILDRNLPQLRQSLQDQGLAIADLGVSLESGGHQGQSEFEEQAAGFFQEQAFPPADTGIEDTDPVLPDSFKEPFSPDQGLNIRV